MEQDIEKQSKKYELSFLSKEEGGKEILLQWISRFGGEIVLEGPVESIVLSYPIEKQTSANFGFVHFNMAPDQAAELSKELKTAGIFLRFLVITPPSVKTNKPRVSSSKNRPAEAAPAVVIERKSASDTLSNEDLEKKIEEILQQQ